MNNTTRESAITPNHGIMTTLKFSQIVKTLKAAAGNHIWLAYNLQSDPELTGVTPIDEATPGTLSYIEGAKFAARVTQTAASALILPLDDTLQAQASERGIAWIASAQPRLAFAQAIALFYQPFQPAPSIHPSAVIDPCVVVGESVHIGANVVIQARVKIGHGVCIHPNVVVYPDAEIGDRTVVHANSTIAERSLIGADCVIQSGAVIGGEGFGFVPTAQGWFKMQQSGRVVLEDGVEVGCNSTIDRPAVGETRLGGNTKLDNLVHIGHGCKIGRNCAFAAQVTLAGGVTIGNNVLLGGQTAVANQVQIGDRAIATGQSGIHRDVQPGAIISGSPAVDNQIYLRASAIYKRLPQMYRTLKQLQKRLQR